MDRFDAMAAFVAVVEHDGFAAAARRLGLSPSATTRLVAGLEDRLGVRLLNRTTRSVGVTDAGARFLERARRILADLADAEALAESERAEPSGRLVITAPLVFGRLHVAPLVGDYLRRHAGVEAELVLGDRNANLIEDGIDVAVRIGALADSGDVARRIGATRRVLVAAPSYLAAAGTPATPADLAGYRLIAFTALSGRRAWRFGNGAHGMEIAIKPSFTTNSAEVAIGHAVDGGGIAMALGYQVVEQVRRGALQVVLADHEPPASPIQFVYPSARLLAPKVRALVDLAVETRDWSFVDF